MCVAPGQIGGKEDNGERGSITGWALLFHPDLLHGTPLEKTIKGYSFFDCRVDEALHMTDEEHDTLVSLMRQIRNEVGRTHDAVQDAIIMDYIGLVLNFCQRFYSRQFLTRKLENTDALMKFDTLLRDYFEQSRQLTENLPTVPYCADKLCMSANYFGDMVKRTKAIRRAIISANTLSGERKTDLHQMRELRKSHTVWDSITPSI